MIPKSAKNGTKKSPKSPPPACSKLATVAFAACDMLGPSLVPGVRRFRGPFGVGFLVRIGARFRRTALKNQCGFFCGFFFGLGGSSLK